MGVWWNSSRRKTRPSSSGSNALYNEAGVCGCLGCQAPPAPSRLRGSVLVHQPPHSQGEIHRRASIGDIPRCRHPPLGSKNAKMLSMPLRS